MKTLFLYISFLFAFQAFSQHAFNKTAHNFGEINRGSTRYADFIMSNLGSKNIYILRIEKDEELSVKLSGKTLAPDSSVIIRIQYNPKSMGSFHKKIPVYISSANDPVLLSISGKVNYLEENYLQDCPDFSATRKIITNIFTLRVRDADSKKPIAEAEVEIISRGEKIAALQTGSDGKAQKPLQPGMYYLVTTAKNYSEEEQELYINRNNDSATVYLKALPQKKEPLVQIEEKKLPAEITQAKKEPKPLPINKPAPQPEKTIAKVQERKKEETKPEPVKTLVRTEEKKEEAITPEPVVNTEFSAKEFVPNNLVFLVDLSSSMNEKGKLDLLKASLLSLIDLLRDVDRVAIVSFASGTQLILPSTAVSNKEKIKEVIKNMEAGGFTAGAKGIKQSYEVANSNYIAGGNNQIFVMSDGAFNVSKEERDLPEFMKQNADKNIGMSVIGIKNEAPTEPAMKKIAENGNGHYLHIDKYKTAKALLVEEIKRRSRK